MNDTCRVRSRKRGKRYAGIGCSVMLSILRKSIESCASEGFGIGTFEYGKGRLCVGC